MFSLQTLPETIYFYYQKQYVSKEKISLGHARAVEEVKGGTGGTRGRELSGSNSDFSIWASKTLQGNLL